MKCDKVLYYFEKINQIPRGSGNEKAVSDYLKKFAEERNLWVHQDSANNIIIKAPATKGLENSAPVAIQGHMDMVCEKNPNVEHDFLKDPIKVIYDGDFIHADGTTLGADDGVAVAMALAILDDDTIAHPPLEIIITTDEEVCMVGAANLDISLIKARRLINLDSDCEGVFTVGCAGGSKTNIYIPTEYKEPCYSNSALIRLTGLEGGHSGIDIDKERANANKIMARVISSLSQKGLIEVASVKGGAKDNAIPIYAEVACVINNADEVKNELNSLQAMFRSEYFSSDRNITLTLEQGGSIQKVFTEFCLKNIITAIELAPNGIQSMNRELDMPESSCNLGVVITYDECVKLLFAPRSAVKSKRDYINQQLKSLAEICGGKVEINGEYPAWEYKENSPLRDLCILVYKDLYNATPRVETIHAGVECGLLAEKAEDMDMISIGPNLYDIHTPREKASISSLERVWNYTLEVLKRL